ncbi:Yip1 family protein [Dokdonella sp.]|uniref:Yip1 family protein n=1 Tax=Dokdonella sp. TaxID=2291710 RepID=UPI003C5F83AE
MDFSKLIARVKGILLTPKTEWPVIAAEAETVAGLYKNYILILAAIPAVFGFIKGSVIGYTMFGVTVRTPFVSGIFGMLVAYGLTLVVVYLVAMIINALAPSFGGEKNQTQALKAAAYTYTASWIASVATVIPWIGWLVVLAGAAYGIYLLYLGLPHTMRCPQEKSVGYTIVTIIIGFVLSIVVGMVVGGITAAGTTAGAINYGNSSSNVTIDTDSTLGKFAAMGQQLEKQSKKIEAAKRSGDANAQAEAAGAMLGAMLGGGDQVEALPPDAIKQFLPEKLAGFKRESISVERSGAMGVQVSTGRATYRDANENRLQLEVTDMGGAKGIMALAGFANVESDKQTDYGYEKTYKQDGRLINERWDNNGNNGEFGIILGDRFSVKLSGNGEGLDMNILKSALSSLNLGGLEAMKNQGVKQG